MGKSTRKPVLAAGGIVVRDEAKPLVAIVQRRRDDAWVLPKGKLKPKERPIAAAKREATEETGCPVRVHEFLGIISYDSGGGAKIAHFWRMQAVGDGGEKPMDDIRAVEWLPLSTAVARLTLSHERQFLRSVGRKALKRRRKDEKKTRPKRRPKRRILRVVGKKRTTAPVPAVAAAPAVAPTPPAAHAPAAQPPSPPVGPRGIAAPRDIAVATSSDGKVARPEPRWNTLTRLTNRWQSAMGRKRRAG